MIRLARFFLLLAVPTSLAACALDPGGSYVSRIGTPADAQVLAASMARFVAAKLPAASSTIMLEPTPSGQASNPLTPAFTAALRDRGFAIANRDQAGTAGVHRVRYLVTPLGHGDLVRVSIDGETRASRFFVRNSAGGLQAGGPLTVLDAAAAG